MLKNKGRKLLVTGYKVPVTRCLLQIKDYSLTVLKTGSSWQPVTGNRQPTIQAAL